MTPQFGAYDAHFWHPVGISEMWPASLQDRNIVSQTVTDESKLPFWKRSHYLDRMTLRDLVAAYFQHYTIVAYLSIAALCVIVWAIYPAGVWQTLGAIAAAVFFYPLGWHLLHQYVLHGQWMYKV